MDMHGAKKPSGRTLITAHVVCSSYLLVAKERSNSLNWKLLGLGEEGF